MGDCGADDSAGQTRRASTLGECARGAERYLLRPVDCVPMEGIPPQLYVAVREQAGREPSPTVAIIDSQTAKGSQKGGLGSILRATTRARRSRVANGTSWSTRWASC